MLSITISVTDSPVYLKQIHQITVHNVGMNYDGKHKYQLYLDGEKAGSVYHWQDYGALKLVGIAIDRILRDKEMK